jgi:hypothetical protein
MWCTDTENECKEKESEKISINIEKSTIDGLIPLFFSI